MKFAEVLKKLRTSHNLTQAELAVELKISKSTISMYENGQRNPDRETYEKIADFFNVDINTLYGFAKAAQFSTLAAHEMQLLEKYRDLNSLGQKEAQKQVENLTYIPKYQKLSTMPESHSNESEVQEEEDHLMPIAAHSTEPDGDVSEAVAIAKAFLKNRKKDSK